MNFRQDWVRLKSERHRFATLTAYDFPFAKLLDDAGLDLILVGDSLGMVVLGMPDTVEVGMPEMLHHTAAVARAAAKTPIVADLPNGSVRSNADTLTNALALLKAGAHAVKMEGGLEVIEQVRTLVEQQVPVLGHIGMLPQRVREEGGYRIKGRSEEEAERLIKEAKALQEAGVFGIVLELVSPPLAEQITRELAIPTIGIGSGEGCDGQILVTYDLLGLFPWFKPKFVQPRLNLAADIRKAVAEYVSQVRG